MKKVVCFRHKLSLLVRHMMDSKTSLGTGINNINDTMKSCKLRLKNGAILRNISYLNVVMRNVNRWSSVYTMVSRFFELATC